MNKTANTVISFNLIYFYSLKRRLYNFDIITYITRVIKNDKIYTFKYLKFLDNNKNSLNKVSFNIKFRHFD